MALSQSDEGEELLAATRKRAERIDRYVDMIPARFYLPSEALQAHKPRSGLDPAQYKPTSQLLSEILSAAAAPATASTAGKGKKKKEKKQPAAVTDAPSSRGELRGRLERRIAELKEERRRKQSDADKAKHAASKGAQSPKAAPRNDPPAPAPGSSSQKAKAARHDEPEDVEAGRLSFQPRASDLPFEASVNRRGAKVKQLRANLRKEEAKKRKLNEVEERGDEGEKDQLRQDMALDVALRRARGEKVHDDISRLRKQQKQMELRKVKGKEKWQSREDERIKKSEEQQQKRKDNLKNHRSKKEKKGGKARVGFEGQKSGYLNKDK